MNLLSITAPISLLSNQAGTIGLLVDDSADSSTEKATLSQSSSSASSNPTAIIAILIGLRPQVTVTATCPSGVTLLTSLANGDEVDVLGTCAATNVQNSGFATVDVGKGNVQSMAGPLSIDNKKSRATDVTVDDSMDGAPHNVTLSTFIKTGFVVPWMDVAGLAPADITCSQSAVARFFLKGSSGGASFTLNALPQVPVALLGGPGGNTLIGPNRSNTWFINSNNGGILDKLFTFANVANLVGGSSTDLFRFADGKGVSGILDGAAGTNTLDYSLWSTGVTVDLTAGTATSTAGVSNIENVTGSPFNDFINGNAANNVIKGNGGSDVLRGQGGNDTFVLAATQAASTTIDGGTGTNTLVGPNATNTWTLTSLTSGNVNGIAFSNIQNLTGGTGIDTLIAPDTVNTWTVTNNNAGRLNAVLGFSGMENLVGNQASDTFKLSNGKGVTGSINGGGGGDWLDYSAYTVAVTVNLATGTATNIGGGATGRILNIQNVHGGNAGNTLTGNSQGNILIGGTGADTIHGGTGRSLLIGDKGADHVTGGSGNDILIGDYTTYDNMSAANEKALMSILAEWQSADSYSTRFHDINTGTGGLNGTAKLNFGTTVLDDAAADIVTAAASSQALDWFFQGVGDTLFNKETGEHVNNS